MQVDPEAAGMDAGRLGRIDEHLLQRYVEPGKIAGCQIVVARHGAMAHWATHGLADLERQRPVCDDTVWRLYSMTKPVTAVALLTLYERGMFQLRDPVHRFIPAFGDVKVRQRDGDGDRLVAPERPMTVRDALMHMTGIGYGPKDARFSVETLTSGKPPSERAGPGATLESFMERLAAEPLVSQPGAEWLYAWSTDVCARLVEVLSGERFDEYVRTAIFQPLGMDDTGFRVRDDQVDRFAANYTRGPDKRLVLIDDPRSSGYRDEPSYLSGSAGLVGTAADYLRFCSMLAGGGQLDGARVLSRKTVELMSTNHLPGGGELRDVVAPGGYGEVGFDGVGFGLTVAVNLGPARTAAAGSAGEYSWGGAASTLFWIDPVEQLVCIFLTQMVPSGTFDFRGQLKSVVYGALTD
jgi:CubicO group peptidase (beta-lactamase class C family)